MTNSGNDPDLEKKAQATPGVARLIFQPNGRQAEVPLGTNLLQAARQMGVEIESICGGRQTCGKCRILVQAGEYPKYGIRSTPEHLSDATPREARYAARAGFAANARLSCGGHVLGDLLIEVPEESQTRKQVVRKGPGIERVVTIDAPMRLYYVELPQAELKDHRGDWERLQAMLAEVHGVGIESGDILHADLSVLRELQAILATGGRAVTATVYTRPTGDTLSTASHEDAPRPPQRRENAPRSLQRRKDAPRSPQRHEVLRIQPGFHDILYGISLDVGTTTLAGQLCNLRTGEILATASRMNPQVPYGEDLMSRISYTMLHDGGAEQLHTVLIDGINGLVVEVCAQAGVMPSEVVEMVIVGNTTMHHLLLGISPRELGGAPFSLAVHGALDIKARDLGIRIAAGGNIHVPPCQGGHVGADNVGVLVAEAPYHQDDSMLILDVGTNGEILLGNRQQVLSASSPTGPAFEGAQILHGMRAADGAIERVRIDPATLAVSYMVIGRPEWVESSPTPMLPQLPEAQIARRSMAERMMAYQSNQLRPAGICGSGIIEAVAELFMAGVLAPNGRFLEFEHPRLTIGRDGKPQFVLAWGDETVTGEPIVVHAEDIRAIQLAKAALYAGAKLLMTRQGIEQVDRVELAGGFGAYIDPRHAMILGMFPNCPLAQVRTIGNAAGDGARMILMDKCKRDEAVWAARWTEYVETAVEAAFQDEFVGALTFPHATDVFPQVRAWLEAAQAQWPDARRAVWDAMTKGQTQPRDPVARAQRRAARVQRKQSSSIADLNSNEE